jgi:menaquinone-dependent protoporphyrinogen oxidase
MSRILLVYASSHGQTRKVADAIADELRRGDHTVDLAPILTAAPPPLRDYDAVVLGSRVQYGKHARPIVGYIRASRAAFADRPTYFFSVSMAASSGAADPDGYLEQLFTATHWRPREAAAIAGALHYRAYGWLVRWIMKRISAKTGCSTDTSRDHEYTDWSVVQQFAARIVADLRAGAIAKLDARASRAEDPATKQAEE